MKYKPIISAQPVDCFVGLGDDAVFNVDVSAVPPAQLQWFDGDNELPGETASTLTIPGVTIDDLRFRRLSCVASNGLGVARSKIVRLLSRDKLPLIPAHGNLAPAINLEEGEPLVLEINGSWVPVDCSCSMGCVMQMR